MRLALAFILASAAATAQTIDMDAQFFRDVARQNAARDAARAQEKQTEILKRIERNQRDRDRQLERQERNGQR